MLGFLATKVDIYHIVVSEWGDYHEDITPVKTQLLIRS